MSRTRSFLATLVVGCVLVVGAVLGGHGTGLAAAPVSKGNGNGLKIAPVRTDINIDKGASQTVSLFVENIMAYPVTINAIINDFVPSTDESGEPRIILDNSRLAPSNSFKSLVSTAPTISLEPNERREVKVTLSVPTDAASGGYYGAVRFSPSNGENNQNVVLTASVGTIFLVRVPGNISEKLSVESFDVSRDNKLGSYFGSGPISVETRFRNFGNIHVQPFGKIYIKNFSGKIIETIEINNVQPRGSVLPASSRKFSDPIKQQRFLGKYTAEANFGYGSNGELLLATKTFYVIPYKLIGIIVGVILLVVIVVPRLIRMYRAKHKVAPAAPQGERE